MSQSDVTAKDALEIARNAVQKAVKNQETIQELQERIVRLEAATVDVDKDYQQMDKAEKVATLRTELVKRAQDTNGKAALDYEGVQYGTFDGNPSAGHVYNLMQAAAEDVGFNYEEPNRGNKRITVNLAERKAQAGFSGVNKESRRGDTTQEGSA